MERRNRDGGCGLTGRFSIAVLIAANLLPLAGVLFWDWDVFLVLLLFWCENVVIGLLVEPADLYGMIIEKLNWVAVVALFVSHGWSLVENYLGSKEHENLTPGQAMALPYRRMMITHVALIVGGFFLIEEGQPLAGLILLIAMKIALDVIFHRKEHQRLAVSS